MKIIVPGPGSRGSHGERAPDAIAVSSDGQRWLLLNAAAGLVRHRQIEAAAAAGAIAGVVLLDAQPVHASGLLALRSARPLDLYATPGVFEELKRDESLFDALDERCGVRWHPLPVAGDTRSAEFGVGGLDALRLRAVDVGGCAAPYSPHRREAVVGDSVALLVEDRLDGRCFFYSPGTPDESVRAWMEGAHGLFVNGSGCRIDGRDLPAAAAADTMAFEL